MQKVLYILKHNPWGVGGGCFASLQYFNVFINVFENYEFYIQICEEYMKDIPQEIFKKYHFIGVKRRSKVRTICEILFEGILHRHYHQARKMLKSLSFSYCIFDHSSIAGSLVTLANRNGAKTIVLNHNFEPDYFADNSPYLSRIVLLPYVMKMNKRAFLKCDFNIFLSEEDSIQCMETFGKSPTRCIIGGLFEMSPCPIPRDCTFPGMGTGNIVLIITGSLSNVQNRDALDYFLSDLYPLIPHSYQIIIAGKNPTEELIKRINESENIELIANPKNMENIVRKGTIYICTARKGSGVKVRITDGLKSGLPIIAHSVSARGYSDFINKGYLATFVSNEEFVSELNSMVNKIKKGKITRTEISDYYFATRNIQNGINKIKKEIFIN